MNVVFRFDDGIFDVDAFPLFSAVLVDEGVREDSEEPCAAVGALFEAVEMVVGFDHRVLDEVFGVSFIVREFDGHGVKGLHVRHGYFLEAVIFLSIECV